ncbi:MAG: hypothetical protein Q4G42_04315 [Neisseria sp.]|nr:hypothetical protein [Neisseria sp.]
MKAQYWLLPTVLLCLNGCVGLTFDDIFNPNVTQSEDQRNKVEQEAVKEQTATALPKREEKPANTVDSSKKQVMRSVVWKVN